jgi:hypothetical protein
VSGKDLATAAAGRRIRRVLMTMNIDHSCKGFVKITSSIIVTEE